jgi:uncharacterized protein (DUF1778 family)
MGKKAAGRGSGPREVINLRATAEQKALIDRAAARLGMSRNEFMIESARSAAENALLDQRLFLVDESDFAAFRQALEAPAEPDDALRRLLGTPAPWET